MSDEGFALWLYSRENKFTNASYYCIGTRCHRGLLLFGQDNVANYIKPFGDIFLNLIKMIIIPIVFCALALSISNLGDSKR